MSRSKQKYSSGFHEMPKLRATHDELTIMRVNNGESSTVSNWTRQSNPNKNRPFAAVRSSIANEVVVVQDSDDEEENYYDNNNEESSPNRHGVVDTEENIRDSNETEKNDESDDGDDEPVLVSEYTLNNLEVLSKITSNLVLDPKDKVGVEDFELLVLLGTGAYGKVFLVKKKTGKDTGSFYAMKILEKTKVTAKNKTTEHTRTEREVLEKVIKCPYLATMHYAFQTPQKLYLVLEFVQGGELFTHLYKVDRFPEDQARIYIAEIIVAIEQLHELRVIYRDIKLENILLDSKGHIIITDFGLSKEILGDVRAHSFCGTIEYMAPEIVSMSKEGHDLNVDWWSIGVLTIELLTGKSPFSPNTEDSSQTKISERIQNEPPEIPDSIGDDAKDFIVKLLQKVPSKRLGYKNDAADLKVHPFFKNINWKKLTKKEIETPMTPDLKGEDDVSYFSEEFTKKEAVDSPCPAPTAKDAANYFRGYSFVAPQWRKTDPHDTVLPPSLERRVQINRPSIVDVLKSKNKQSPFFKKYHIKDGEKPIGDGTYSICMRCSLIESGKEYAVKIMDKSHDASQEIEALNACQGQENIVKLIDHLKDSSYIYIVFELLGGVELFSRIRDLNNFSEPDARNYFQQLIKAVEFIHQKNIVHRDLKPENIMFTDKDSSKLKIVDFGFARRKTSLESPPCYTVDYAAPESLEKGATNEGRDMWSLGVILYTMLVGHTPFTPEHIKKQQDEGIYRRQLEANIKNGSFNQKSELWNELSLPAKDLVSKLLKVNERNRLTLPKVLEHAWMTEGDFDTNEGLYETEMLHVNGVKEPMRFDETITVDDSNDAPPTDEKEIREEVCSNDSSGIVLSDRNEGSSLSSHVDDPEEVQKQVTAAGAHIQDQTHFEVLSSSSEEYADLPETATSLPLNGDSSSTFQDDSNHQPKPEASPAKSRPSSERQEASVCTSLAIDYVSDDDESCHGFDDSVPANVANWHNIFNRAEPTLIEEDEIAEAEHPILLVPEISTKVNPTKGKPPKVKAASKVFIVPTLPEEISVTPAPVKRGRPKKVMMPVKTEKVSVRAVHIVKPKGRTPKRKIEDLQLPSNTDQRPANARNKQKPEIQPQPSAIFELLNNNNNCNGRYPKRRHQEVEFKPEPVQWKAIQIKPPAKPRAEEALEAVRKEPQKRGRKRKAPIEETQRSFPQFKPEPVEEQTITFVISEVPKTDLDDEQEESVVYPATIYERRNYGSQTRSPKRSFMEYRAMMLRFIGVPE